MTFFLLLAERENQTPLRIGSEIWLAPLKPQNRRSWSVGDPKSIPDLRFSCGLQNIRAGQCKCAFEFGGIITSGAVTSRNEAHIQPFEQSTGFPDYSSIFDKDNRPSGGSFLPRNRSNSRPFMPRR